jgi:adenylate kinase
MHKYIIMGPQGSGKGTQAKLLAADYDLTHFSVGDIFRWNIQVHTKMVARIKRIMAAGELVPDEMVEEIITRRLEQHDWNYGFIIDGFPRNASQAEFFLESYDVDGVIHLDVPDHVTRERAMSRRKCSECGLDYNLMHHRPETDGVCDVCGGHLVARADDTEEALDHRLHDYNTKTLPTLDLFKRKELVVHVDGTGTVEESQKLIRQALKLE